jgi:hypothetical protein
VQYVKEFDKHIKMGGTMRSVGGTQNVLVQYVKEFDKHIKMGGTMRSVGGTQNV